MEAGRESRVSGEVAAYSDARTSVIATSPSSELRPLMPNFAQQQFRAEHVSVGSKTEVAALQRDVCFAPVNGHRRLSRHVRKVPGPDIAIIRSPRRRGSAVQAAP